MAKKIIFCADGTWNGPAVETGEDAIDGTDDHGEPEAKITNVVKLFANLAGRTTPETLTLHNEQERALVDPAGVTVQIAKYMHGVGDSSNALKKALGGVFGMGVIGRVVRGFTFISRHYDPGDEIHIAGFSRGAYTARALAGMIASVGLLNRAAYDASDKEEAYRLGIAAWCKGKGVALNGAGKLTELGNHLLNCVAGFFARTLPRHGLVADVPIKSVAVWDTVGSMGIPRYAGDRRYDVFRFADTALSPKVERGFHAMAIDELRLDFPVTRWENRPGISQVWFVGAHADVGGGYAANECGLSDIALDWIMRQLSGLGVRLATPLTYTPNKTLIGQKVHEPWGKFPFSKLPQSAREVIGSDMIHESVFKRWETDGEYRPKALGTFKQSGLGGLRREN